MSVLFVSVPVITVGPAGKLHLPKNPKLLEGKNWPKVARTICDLTGNVEVLTNAHFEDDEVWDRVCGTCKGRA